MPPRYAPGVTAPEEPRPTFVGPDGETYEYADPAASPAMDEVDSTTIAPPEGAPIEPVEVAGESTPEAV